MEENNIPSSTIILKHNSQEQNKTPLSDNLEVGEIALGLVKDNESIWAKNSDGEVVNLRVPRVDLFWGNMLMKFETIESFEEYKSQNVIPSTSIVFVGGERPSILVDNVYYSVVEKEEDIVNIIKEISFNIPEELVNLSSSSLDEDIQYALSLVDGFDGLKAKSIEASSIFIKTSITTIAASVLTCEDKIVINWFESNKMYLLTIERLNGRIIVFKSTSAFETVGSVSSMYTALSDRIDNAESAIESKLDKSTFASQTVAGVVKMWVEKNPITGLYELNISTN